MGTEPSKEAVELAEAIVKRFNDYLGDTTESCSMIAQRALDKATDGALLGAATRVQYLCGHEPPTPTHCSYCRTVDEILALRRKGDK